MSKSTKQIHVKFKKSYIASRGPGIAGAKGDVRQYRMTDALEALIDEGIVEVVKGPKAETREKATGKKNAEKS